VVDEGGVTWDRWCLLSSFAETQARTAWKTCSSDRTWTSSEEQSSVRDFRGRWRISSLLEAT
jgi:hypothetical protein